MTEAIEPLAILGSARFAFSCAYCEGSGEVSRDNDDRAPYIDCVVCKRRGTALIQLAGREPFAQCRMCHGRGRVARDRDGRAPWVVCTRCAGVGVQALLGTFSVIEPSPDIFFHQPANPSRSRPDMKTTPCVFIVHGRNHSIRDQVDLFLSKDLGLKTAVMQAGAHGGRTLSEKFEEIAATCDFAVFILTADDHLTDLATNSMVKRARQNVVLEVGYFWGALGRRQRVAFLVEADKLMELPSDIQGIGWIPITADLGETKLRLQAELRAAGLI